MNIWDDTPYQRFPGEYTAPPNSLWITGSARLSNVTGYSNEEFFDSLPTCELITVELVPEPGNPADPTAVALDIEERRIGYLRRGTASRMHPAVVSANRCGYRVLAQGKIFESGDEEDGYSYRFLDLRGTWPENLSAWLQLPAAVRGHEFFEVMWNKADRQFNFQASLNAVLADQSSMVTGCNLLLGTTEDGIGVDVYIEDTHVGTLRPRSRYGHDELIAHVRSGAGRGLAKLFRWPDNIELEVLIPGLLYEDDEGGEDFLWAEEAQAKEDAEWADFDARWKRAKEVELYQGRAPHEWAETIDALYRAGELAETLELLVPVMAAEAAAQDILGDHPSSFYTQRAAIIYRKLKDYSSEVDVLERLMQRYSDPDFAPQWLPRRLARARDLEQRAQTTAAQ
ncbi:hypothetical protein [Rhodococcus pyridinivorans]|uniref:hypothetical protein n=1 Tax=Rhodococcus pyridinivorans TaxID=103816 RepID=UPI0022843C3B|nr:hypothetical protein [Rhodococcus pyridinivorans]WAL49794.1 hypothetical protein OQN32_28585 [Rhodococcus pyridinivorans]